MRALKNLLGMLIIALCITVCGVVTKYCFTATEFAEIPRVVLGASIGGTVLLSVFTTLSISKLHEKYLIKKEKKLSDKFDSIEEKLLNKQSLTYIEQKLYDKYLQIKGKKLKEDIEALDSYFNGPLIKKSGLYCLGTVENENTTCNKTRNFITKNWPHLIDKLKRDIYLNMIYIEDNKIVKSSNFVGSFIGDYKKVNIKNDFWIEDGSLEYVKQNMNFFYKVFTFYSKEQGQSLLNFLNEYSHELNRNVKKMPTPVSKVKHIRYKPEKNKQAVYYQEDER
ncbi:MAG: hypothetical protein WCX32_01590 [Clostridia bacterium]|jgi:hypothetical protein